MQELLQHPAVQAGVVPFVVALVIGGLLMRSRVAWLAIVLGYAATLQLVSGISLFPLTVSRKAMLVVMAAPLLGLLIDRFSGTARSGNADGAGRDADAGAGSGWLQALPVLLIALSAVWIFYTVLSQREVGAAVLQGAGVVLYVGVMLWAVRKLLPDGTATSAAGLGLGLSVGIAALLSASTGYFAAGVAVGAASGGLLLLQFVSGRTLPASHAGALVIGAAASLFSSATVLLAQLPWWCLPLFLCVPLAVGVALPSVSRLGVRPRTVLFTLAAVVVAVIPVLAAWWSAQGGQS